MPKLLNPETVSRPASRFSQAVAHGPAAKRLLISGQVGARPDGTVVDGIDMLTWDADGLLIEFAVLVRPFRALTTLMERMAGQLAVQQAAAPPPA